MNYADHVALIMSRLGDDDESPVGDPQPTPCPDCGGTGSDCTKFPIVGCATCEGDGRLQMTKEKTALVTAVEALKAVLGADPEDARDIALAVEKNRPALEGLYAWLAHAK